MPTFAWAESPGSSEESTPRESVVQIGNGYQDVEIDNLHPVARAWPLRFNEAGRTGGDAIMAFFRANAGQPFDWSPMWATAPIKVRCTSWSRVLDDDGLTSTITARFEEWFGP